MMNLSEAEGSIIMVSFEGLFESEFSDDLVYKFRKIVGKADF